jgi:hypothetical protein
VGGGLERAGREGAAESTLPPPPLSRGARASGGLLPCSHPPPPPCCCLGLVSVVCVTLALVSLECVVLIRAVARGGGGWRAWPLGRVPSRRRAPPGRACRACRDGRRRRGAANPSRARLGPRAPARALSPGGVSPARSPGSATACIDRRQERRGRAADEGAFFFEGGVFLSRFLSHHHSQRNGPRALAPLRLLSSLRAPPPLSKPTRFAPGAFLPSRNPPQRRSPPNPAHPHPPASPPPSLSSNTHAHPPPSLSLWLPPDPVLRSVTSLRGPANSLAHPAPAHRNPPGATGPLETDLL